MSQHSEPTQLKIQTTGEKIQQCIFFLLIAFFTLFLPLIGWLLALIFACAAFASLLTDTNFRVGKCPYCGFENTVTDRSPGANCPACKKRFLIKDGEFWTIDEH